MPYILLIIGLILGLYALYRFFMKATISQIKALFLTLMVLTVVLALFYLAVTGRLPAALGLLAALVPFGIGYLRQRKQEKAQKAAGPSSSGKPMTRKEALDILGLKDGASEDDIKSAYKTLMKKMHPDQEGTGWMAAKLNEAKDFLLKRG